MFLAASCQRVFRRMQAFMFASKAFSSHFSCFLVDETHHLHADLLLIKRPENSNWVSPPKKSKVMLEMIQKLTRKITIIDILAVRAIFPVMYSWKMLSCGIS